MPHPTVEARCPSPHVLDRYATEGIRDAQLDAHLSGCPHCRSELGRIQGDNAFLRGLGGDDTHVSGAAPEAADRPIRIPGYEIAHEINRGRQGIVYKAVQRSTRQTVAIKMMRGAVLPDPLDRMRFEREVKILAALEHPHIVAIHDSGVMDGIAYLVMDYVPGRSLVELIADRRNERRAGGRASGRAPGSSVRPRDPRARIRNDLEVFAKICEAVDAAHLRGVIHRDLKPGNIRVDERGEPRVLDFGLAKIAVDPVEGAATMITGAVVGTPAYASPEQLSGRVERLDIRTDVYSLGVILYEMLTGELPVESSGTVFDIAQRVRTVEPVRPRARCPEIDDDLSTIVMQCLQKEPDRRYRNAGDVARDIHRYLKGEPLDARRDSTWYVLRKTIARHRTTVFATLGVIAALAGLAAYVRSVEIQKAAVERAAFLQAQRTNASLGQALASADALFTLYMRVISSIYNDNEVRKASAPLVVSAIRTALRDVDVSAGAVSGEVEGTLRVSFVNFLTATEDPADLQLAREQLDAAERAFNRSTRTAGEVRGLRLGAKLGRARIFMAEQPPNWDAAEHEFRDAVYQAAASGGWTHAITLAHLGNAGNFYSQTRTTERAGWWLSKAAEILDEANPPVPMRAKLLVVFRKVSLAAEEFYKSSGKPDQAQRLAAIRERHEQQAAESQPADK